MNKMHSKGLLGKLWLAASLATLAACGGNKTEVVAEPAQAPEEPVAVSEPAYAIVTVPFESGPVAQLRTVLDEATDAQVVVLEKVARQLAETGNKSAFFSNLAVIKFESEAKLNEWVGPAAQILGTSASIKAADLVVADGLSDQARPDAFFAVNLYETLVPADQYKTYTQAYIVPNMANQKSSGVMTSYAMYLERAGGQGNPRSILVKEYANEEAFDKSGPIKDAHKEQVLLKDAEWSRINDSKGEIRTDLNETLARKAAL